MIYCTVFNLGGSVATTWSTLSHGQHVVCLAIISGFYI